MSGFDLRMAFMMARSNLAGDATHNDNTIKPTPTQFALGPGDKGFLLTSESELEQGISTVRVLDPEEYAWKYEDWEERLMRGYILCNWRSEDDRLGGMGWFARSKVVPCPEDMWEAFEALLDDTEREIVNEDTFPFDGLYRKHQAEAIKQNEPDAKPFLCEECGSADVVFRLEHDTFLVTAVWWKKNETGKYQLEKGGDEDRGCTLRTWVYCKECDWKRDVAEEEVNGSLHGVIH